MVNMASFDLGGVRIRILDGGRLRLDGGAMFGIIPKALWARRVEADPENRITLACNCILVESDGSAGQRTLIEVGHGCKYGAKEQSIFGIDPERWLLPTLRRENIEPESITNVVLSHLHFDHAGGLTRPRGPGMSELLPTFPNARVHVQRREFEDARANFGIMTATYREENYAPIDAAGGWRLVDGEGEVVPHVRARLTPGHTRGHHSLLIAGRDRTAVFVGDVLPTVAHAGAAYNMAYDVLPLDNRESKRALLAEAAHNHWLLLLDHEPQTPAVTAHADGSWFALTPVST